jgi:transposase-like protein
MTSSKSPPSNEKTTTSPPRRKRTPNPAYSALEKAQAVLAVWTDRGRPADICRQLRINWVTFQQWQNRAMDGMLQALETRVNLAQGGALSPRLQELLQKQSRASSTERLSQRLSQLQQSKVANPAEPGA